MNDKQNKRDIERAELHRTIWSAANDLRGSVDGWDFKQYVLGILFYRFISEKVEYAVDSAELAAFISNGGSEDDFNFSYAEITDEQAEIARESITEEIGLFILPSQLFKNVLKNADTDENLNETVASIFVSIEESALGEYSEDQVKGLFDDIDVNSKRLGNTVAQRNEKLLKLLRTIDNLNMGSQFNDHTIDAFGDAYEYLMAMYASSAGKSGGEYYTPQEVSELLTKIVMGDKKSIRNVYDPACGSGSLLLNFAKVAGRENIKDKFYGQEINMTTFNLARINMFLHGISPAKFDLKLEDTLKSPQHLGLDFEGIVSNPPYSIKWDGDDNAILINDERYSPAGVLAPKSKADLAFIMHILHHLAPDGKAAVVMFPGVFYRGGAEAKIREYLIDNNVVEAVIQLPENLFFGTSIATNILVLSKSKETDEVLFIDASEIFTRATNSNKLSDENIEEIYKLYKGNKEVDHITAVVGSEKIREEDFDLSPNIYIEPKNMYEEIDIVELEAELKAVQERSNKLRAEIDELVREIVEGESKDD